MLIQSILRNIDFDAVVKSHPYTGNRGGPSVSITVKIAPISNVQPVIGFRDVVEAPAHSRQTFLYTNQVIKAGMYLEYGGKEYAIRGIAPYPSVWDPGYTLYQLMLEEFTSR